MRRCRKCTVRCWCNLKIIFGIIAIHLIRHILYLQEDETPTTQWRNSTLWSDKWIVITTISRPTEALKSLAAINGWKIVIVGDAYTPWNWEYPNCVFLHYREQKKMNFMTNYWLPTKSYSRKNIGYLFAIAHGAQWIYDTDDDNEPYNLGLNQFEMIEKSVSLIKKDNGFSRKFGMMFNPYHYYGRTDMWPRGYPLEAIREPNHNYYHLCSHEKKYRSIQQGLVVQDSDVDAIYRLLNADPSVGLYENFNDHVPDVSIAKNMYAPFNSQNTLFHYSAFWALFLPISVTPRVTDIWRGYFAQKLIHYVNIQMSFVRTNARQIRNPHSFLADFQDEIQLFLDSGKLAEALSVWNCLEKDLGRCMLALSKFLVDNGLLGQADHCSMASWLNDLRRINYTFPKIVHTDIEKRMADTCDTVFLSFQSIKSESYNSFIAENLELQANPKSKKLMDVFLFLVEKNFLKNQTLTLMQYLNERYSSSKHMVFFCTDNTENLPFLQLKSTNFNIILLQKRHMKNSHLGFSCLEKLKELGLLDVSGAFVIPTNGITYQAKSTSSLSCSLKSCCCSNTTSIHELQTNVNCRILSQDKFVGPLYEECKENNKHKTETIVMNIIPSLNLMNIFYYNLLSLNHNKAN